LRQFNTKGLMNNRGFMTVSVMLGMTLLVLGYFVYDGHRGGGMMGRMMGKMMDEKGRHSFLMSNGVPEKYAELTNPLAESPENISAGKSLYSVNCVSCHGKTGIGDGAAGKMLDPQPANLVAAMGMPMASDSFLFWSISAGGQEFKSAMPAFENVLSKNERWLLITYLRQF